MGVALLVPLTFGMEPTAGLLMLAQCSAEQFYGGATQQF